MLPGSAFLASDEAEAAAEGRSGRVSGTLLLFLGAIVVATAFGGALAVRLSTDSARPGPRATAPKTKTATAVPTARESSPGTGARACCEVGSTSRQAILSRARALKKRPETRPPEPGAGAESGPSGERSAPKKPESEPSEKKRPAEPASSVPGPSSAQADAPAPVSSIRRSGRRVRIADESGQVRVARVYGGEQSKAALMPDGRIVWPNRLVMTDEAFEPWSAEESRDYLLENVYPGFKSKITEHYVILYQCSKEFADASARLLESLYVGLIDQCLERGLEVHGAEFPLVAVIYRTEADFRAHNDVDPDVEAFYDIVTNRIFFYETTRTDTLDPKLAAKRRPQTVAHEGTHQVLQNIGAQPRMADWPPWLVEGLAELASSSQTRADRWAGFGKVNSYHLATLQDLHRERNNPSGMTQPAGYLADRMDHQSMVQYIVTRNELNPTDYALAWSLTHYLNRRHSKDFLAYLRRMGRMTPFEPHSAADHLESFRDAFGVEQLPKLDRSVERHVGTLFRDPSYVPVYYFAVTFEQQLPTGCLRRGTIVSQSPSIIQEWLVSTATPQGGVYVWHAYPFPSRGSAEAYTRQWLSTR
jgi:hypothetical protein